MNLPVKVAASAILGVVLTIAITFIAMGEVQRLQNAAGHEAAVTIPLRESLAALNVYIQQIALDNDLLQSGQEMTFSERRTYLGIYKEQREAFYALRQKLNTLVANTPLPETQKLWNTLQAHLDQWEASDIEMEKLQQQLFDSGMENANALESRLHFFEADQGAMLRSVESSVVWASKSQLVLADEIPTCALQQWWKRVDESHRLYQNDHRQDKKASLKLTDGTVPLEYAKNADFIAVLKKIQQPHIAFHRGIAGASKAVLEGNRQAATAHLDTAIEAHKVMRDNFQQLRDVVSKAIELEAKVQKAEDKTLQHTLFTQQSIKALVLANSQEMASNGDLSTAALESASTKLQIMLGAFLLVNLALGAFMYHSYKRNTISMAAMERERETSFAQMHFLFNASPMGCIMRDAEYNLTNCNLAAAKLFGIEEQWNEMDENALAFGLESKWEYLARFAVLLYPELQPDGEVTRLKAQRLLKEALETGKVVTEWMYQTGNGEPLPAEVTLIRAEWMGQLSVVYYIRDLRHEKALKAEQDIINERIRTIFDASPFGFLIRDENGTPIQCNKAMMEIVGATSIEDFQRERIIAFMPQFQPGEKISSAVYEENIRIAMETGHHYFEFLYKRPDGNTVPVEITLVRVTTDGKICRVAYVRELHNVKTLLAQQEEAYVHLQQVLDVAPFSYHIMDESGTILNCNAEAVKLFGLLEKNDFITRYWELLPELQPNGENSYEMGHKQIAAAKDKDFLRFAWMHRTVDGTPLPMQATLVHILWDTQPVVACYLRPLDPHERRTAPRHILLRACTTHWAMPDGNQGNATIVDAGRHGMRLRGDTSKWKSGDRVKLTCQTPPFDAMITDKWGQITWIYGFEAGLILDVPCDEEPGIAIRLFNEGTPTV